MLENSRASDSGSRFRSLLDQIAAQEVVLKEMKEEESKRRAESADSRRVRAAAAVADRAELVVFRCAVMPHPVAINAAPASPPSSTSPIPTRRPVAAIDRGATRTGDHYGIIPEVARPRSTAARRSAKEARAAVEEASRESSGRRKKRKEKRQAEAAAAAEGQDRGGAGPGHQPRGPRRRQGSEGDTVAAELAAALDVSANDIIKRLFLLGTRSP